MHNDWQCQSCTINMIAVSCGKEQLDFKITFLKILIKKSIHYFPCLSKHFSKGNKNKKCNEYKNGTTNSCTIEYFIWVTEGEHFLSYQLKKLLSWELTFKLVTEGEHLSHQLKMPWLWKWKMTVPNHWLKLSISCLTS